MATELTTQPLVHHGDTEQNRLLGDGPGHTHAVPAGHTHALPGHTHAVPGHTHAAPIHTAAVPVLVGAVPVQAYAVPQQAGVVKRKHGPVKPLMALFLLALAATLIGLLAFQAHHFYNAALVGFGENHTDETGAWGLGDGVYENDDDDDGLNIGNRVRNAADNVQSSIAGVIPASGELPIRRQADGTPMAEETAMGGQQVAPRNRNWRDNVGFNGAGTGMFIFGLLFAVLQAVTALTMWIHLAYYFPYLKHSSVMTPLKVTAAVGFIALGFACRHISLGARGDTSETHHRVVHAIEAFIIINWFFVMLALIVSLVSQKAHWDCDNIEEHRITRRMTAGYTQFFLAIILIGLLAAYFQQYTERFMYITATTEIFITFAIMFAVLQAVSGVAMIQQCGYSAPGQLPETVHALLKVVVAFGIVAFGFACRSIYVSTHGTPWASAHLISIQSFVIINFLVSLYLTYASAHGILNWDNYNTTIGSRAKGFIFGILQLIMSIVLFGLLAGLLQGLTANEYESTDSINAAGKYMVFFGLLFAVLEFFAGCTMLESGTKKLGGLNPSSVSATNKVTLAIGVLAFGFACRHINLYERRGYEGPRSPLVHAIEAFIILNFILTWIIDILCVKGKIEW